jgi:hypothetical protein
MKSVFTNIYEKNLWGNNRNVMYNGSSGLGSSIEYNKDNYIPFLQNFIKTHNIKTVVDLGCGDFVCGKMIYNNLDVIYTGYDAYNKVVNFNKMTNPLPKYNFIESDFCNNVESIISADLCIIKDVLQHWQLNDIYRFLDFIISSKKFKHILIINCCYQTSDNTNIQNGEFRPLSCDFLPLKKYNPIKLGNFYTKEICLINNI